MRPGGQTYDRKTKFNTVNISRQVFFTQGLMSIDFVPEMLESSMSAKRSHGGIRGFAVPYHPLSKIPLNNFSHAGSAA
jgi:hypothetical protein